MQTSDCFEFRLKLNQVDLQLLVRMHRHSFIKFGCVYTKLANNTGQPFIYFVVYELVKLSEIDIFDVERKSAVRSSVAKG